MVFLRASEGQETSVYHASTLPVSPRWLPEVEVVAPQNGASPRSTRILHISDLHFGIGFSQDLWNDLARIARQCEPDVVAVTGDLVENPFAWNIIRARRALAELKKSIEGTSRRQCQIVVIPGNHDTRILGLLPVIWLTRALVLIWVSVVSLLLVGCLENLLWLLVAVGLTACRLACRNFRKALSDFLVSLPKQYGELSLTLFPFDSASLRSRGAQGEISQDQFVKAGTLASTPFRVALLHHHPLPVPYDAKHEPLMVLRNAGAFLNEVSKHRIQLVLHGHKHNPNYSRCVIRAQRADEFEVGVLGAGTPTASRDPGPQGFGFYLLDLDPRTGVMVTPYVARLGGTFASEEPFWVEAIETRMRRTFEDAAKQVGRAYETIVAVRIINGDGDVYHRAEHHGFRVFRGFLEELPMSFIVALEEGEAGHIERFEAFDLGRSSGVQFVLDETDPQAFSLKRREARLRFGQKVTKDSQPLDFGWHYHALNSCASSVSEYRRMYGDGAPPIEWCKMTLRDAPARELIMVLLFSQSFSVQGRPKLISKDPRVEKLNGDILVDSVAGLVVCRLPYPLLQEEYKLQWSLPPGDTDSASPEDDRPHGEVKDIMKKCSSLSIPSHQCPRRSTLVQQLQMEARIMLSLDEDPEVCVMVWDDGKNALKTVAASFGAGDDRWKWSLKYGDGIAGRAYKKKRGRYFVKYKAEREGTPYYYVPADGKAVRSAKDIVEEVIVSLPLGHPDHNQMVYGVLSLSSVQAGSKLVDVDKREMDRVKYWKVANNACFAVLAGLS